MQAFRQFQTLFVLDRFVNWKERMMMDGHDSEDDGDEKNGRDAKKTSGSVLMRASVFLLPASSYIWCLT